MVPDGFLMRQAPLSWSVFVRTRRKVCLRLQPSRLPCQNPPCTSVGLCWDYQPSFLRCRCVGICRVQQEPCSTPCWPICKLRSEVLAICNSEPYGEAFETWLPRPGPRLECGTTRQASAAEGLRLPWGNLPSLCSPIGQCEGLGRQGASPSHGTGHHWWRTIFRLEVGDHRAISQVFETMLMYDQLDVDEKGCVQILARRGSNVPRLREPHNGTKSTWPRRLRRQAYRQ